MMAPMPGLLCLLLLQLIPQGAAFRGVSRHQDLEPAECQDGNTKEPGCMSVCRWLKITASEENGQCQEFVDMLKGVGHGDDANNSKLGVYKEKKWYKFWGYTSSMEPLIKVLATNCKEHELDFYAAALYQLIENVKKKTPLKFAKYEDELAELQKKLSDVVTQRLEEVLAKEDLFANADDNSTIPACPKDFMVDAGDFLSYEWGGPNFAEVSSMMTDFAMNDEAMRLRLHYSYGPYFSYEDTFNTSTNETWQNRTKGSKIARLFELSWKHTLNIAVKAGKSVGDVFYNTGKFGVDMTKNVGKILGKMGLWTASGLTRLYSRVRQTTPHTNQTRWTHTEIGTGPGYSMSAYNEIGVWHEQPMCGSPGQIVVSRFVGDGTVNASAYRHLAASRAFMWQPHLSHYADTVGEWYRVVAGKCLSVLGTPGSRDYFEAVTPSKVKEMWGYEPTVEDAEKGFYEGMKDSFRTHDVNNSRVKPKAMFCSKFAAAIWSSTIGNPTEVYNATPRARDLKKMFPFNPGACSPWSLVQWLLSEEGRKSWKSCIIEPKRIIAVKECWRYR